VSTIPQWTGKQIQALRAARRMTVRDFAHHLGVSGRMVGKWEAGGDAIRPRSQNQRALDASLGSLDPVTRARFDSLAGCSLLPVAGIAAAGGMRNVARHPVDAKVMTLIEAGPFETAAGELLWVPGYYIDVLPTTCGEYAAFVHQTGHRPPASWPGGQLGPGLDETPVRVPWIDAQSYAAWASKVLPTLMQWDRALQGDERMVAGHLTEWCATQRGPRKHQPPTVPAAHGQPGFRCVLAVEEMLELLVI
jgi:hypothetical protein